MTADFTRQTPQEIERRLTAANAVLDTLTSAIGPTCGFTASECTGGGWLICADGKPYAACTESWEVPEIMGRVMAARFGRSFSPPERADNVTPREEDRLPRVLRPVPREAQASPPDPAGVPARASVMVVLVAAVMLAGSIWGV